MDVVELVSKNLKNAKEEAEGLIKTELDSLITHVQKIVDRYI